jgi:3-deoxy-D-manno-octulosonic-acid transferase
VRDPESIPNPLSRQPAKYILVHHDAVPCPLSPIPYPLYFPAMPILEQLYTLSLHVTRPLLPLLSRGRGKLARGIRGRGGVLQRMEQWATADREAHRPLVWFHAPSVGEGLQARAVMEVIRRQRPDVQLAYTYFSPSAEAFARSLPADFADYLPLDLPNDVERALDLLQPSVIAFTKTEVWPNLSRAAEQRSVGLALLSATLPATSSRLSGMARALLAPAYQRLDRVAAISPADAERYDAFGVAPNRITVMGDARFDQVWRRAAAADPASPLLAPLHDPARLILVAGSTWPADEANLIRGWYNAHDPGTPIRLVLVPHEPTPPHLKRAEALLDEYTISHQRLSDLSGQPPRADVLLVDRVGVLGELYALADLAYVGGGFGNAGLHSVLEPAAFGIPVMFGPRHENAREAAELIMAGGGFEVASVRDLGGCLEQLVRDSALRSTAGAHARAYVEAGLGAAERGATAVLELLDRTE